MASATSVACVIPADMNETRINPRAYWVGAVVLANVALLVIDRLPELLVLLIGGLAAAGILLVGPDRRRALRPVFVVLLAIASALAVLGLLDAGALPTLRV